MPQHPISAPDPSEPVGSATNAIRAHGEDASFETDFADLAARFSAQSGGGLSPELSADLALEIVLNEIVEQACLTTGATGAAIVLQRDGEMVCRASSGPTAPDLGARLDTTSGLTAECVRTRQTQRCDDALIDPRADLEASARLGVRSVLVMPLIRGEVLEGVFELFSARPFAFGEREENTIRVLAARALSNLDRAAKPLDAPHESLPVAEAISQIPRDPISESSNVAEPVFSRKSEVATWALGVAVLVCAMLLGVLLAPHLGLAGKMARTRSARPKPHAPQAVEARSENAAPSAPQPAAKVVKAARQTSVAPGGLLVSENGKEIFRIEPRRNTPDNVQENAVQPAASLEPEQTINLSPKEAEGILLHRVEPSYPEAARQRHIQGTVILDVQIASDGKVQDVQVVSGPALLAQASVEAVKQWTFKARRVNQRPAEMQTQVTLNFRLPQGN